MTTTAPDRAAGLATAALRVPASFFSIATGLATLAMAWRAAARAYGGSLWLAEALLALAALVWLALLAAQIVKALNARAALAAELADPVEGSLASLGPTALLVIAAGAELRFPDLATVLFWVAAAAQVAYGVWIAGRWLVVPVPAERVTPALHLPIAASNLAAGLAAAAVGQREVGLLFFGTGVVAWVVVAAVLLGRYLSAGELPVALRPLLAIEIAPPALALIAWQALEGPAPDAVAAALLGSSLFAGLLVLRLSLRLREAGFGPVHWAFTFPLAALSAAALRQASAAPSSVASGLALPLFVVANAIVAVVAFRTVASGARGKLLPPG